MKTTEPEGLDFSAVKGIVFDLDDTLYPQVEFKRSGFRAVAAWLEERGLARSETVAGAMDGTIERLGPSHPLMFDELVAETGLDRALIPELVEVFRAHKPDIAPYPGVEELLSHLRGKFRLGLLTDGLARVQRSKVEALGLAPFFDEIVFSDERATSKPDPALFEHFEKLWNLKGEELAHIADNPAKDFVGANGRGWLTVRVLTGEHAAKRAAKGFEASTAIETLSPQ